MKSSVAKIRINADVSNPGHFFACCGLLELADRMSRGAEGCFESQTFVISCKHGLPALISSIAEAQLRQVDPEDTTASPIYINGSFQMTLDWWKRTDRPTQGLKVWAGTMESFRIARAMQQALRAESFRSEEILDVGVIAYDPDDPTKKVEPFYFDARRGPNAHSRDVGFSPNDLGMTTTAFPGVEFLCLVGLQRCNPLPSQRPRVYDYHSWANPIPPVLVPAAVAGLLGNATGFRFESWYRTGQKKHKAFLRAQPKTKEP